MTSLIAGFTATETAHAAAPERGFLSEPTDQIAVPGSEAGAEITPEGDLYTGWAEYEPRYGTGLKEWDQPTRTAADPRVPLLSGSLSDGPVRYTTSIFATAVEGRPVAYLTIGAVNESSRRAGAEVALGVAYTRGRQIVGVHGIGTGAFRFERPASGEPAGFYRQSGQPYSADFSYSSDGRDEDRSGLLLMRGPAAPGRLLSQPSGEALTAVHGLTRLRRSLGPHGRVSFTWQIPLEPPLAGPAADMWLDSTTLAAARASLSREWRALEAPLMRVSVPEPKVTGTYYAAIVEMLESRLRTAAGWVQASNRLQYQAFWIRDAAMEIVALDMAGLHEAAAQDLAFLDTFQTPQGLFISRQEQYDGLGQALWALSEHAQLTGSAAYAAAQLERLGAAVGWLQGATGADPLGLLPAGDPHDDELAYGHVTGDDLWAAAGLRSAVADAVLAGRPDLAAGWREVDARFEGALDRALRSAVARAGHIPPVLDASGGQDWGNYYAAYPVQVLAARDPAVRATVSWERAHSVQGLATYADGRSLHDYLGFSTFETELEAGEPADALAGLYAELAHTTSTDEGWELGIAPWGARASALDLSPHGTFAGDYVALLRNMLVREDPDGTIELMSGASPAWLAPGERVAVSGAATDRGTVSFVERSSAGGETLTWSDVSAPGARLFWRLPWWARGAHTPSGRAVGALVELPGSAGRLTVRFTGRRPALSYRLAAAALDAAYRRRRLAPPLRAAAP